MPQITYLCGPPGSGKTREIMARYLTAVETHGSDSVLLLLPDAASVTAATARLVSDTGGLYDARLMTFDGLARALLRSNRDPLSALEPCQRLLLAGRLAVDPQVGLPDTLTRHAGFVRGLCSFVDELKRAAVLPETFSRAVRQAFTKDDRAAGLARFYDRYQQELARQKLFDEAGLFWQARHLLREGRQQPFASARLVLVDGFTDFTTTQLQVLRHLAEGSSNTPEREVIVSFTLPPDEERREGFAAAWAVLERLQEHLGAGQTRWLPASDDRSPVLRHVLDQMLRLQAEVLDDTRGALSIIAAPGLLAEVRETLREVKQLLLDGVPAGDICLIFRSLEAYRRPLQEVARETGVPLAVLGQEPLALRPSVQAVLDLLQVPLGDYMARDVVKLLKSNFVDTAPLQTDGREISPEQFEVVAVEARVIGGRKHWAEQFKLYGDRLEEELRLARLGQALGEDVEARDPSFIQSDQRRLEAAGLLFSTLASRLDRLAKPQTRSRHVEALGRLISELGLDRRIMPGADPDAARAAETSANLNAFREFRKALQQFADADRLLQPTETITFEDFCQELIGLCQDTTFDSPAGREGRVLAVDAYHARQLRRPHVFVGGLVEGQWPAPRHEHAFFDDRERRRLNALGLPLSLSSQLQHDETYLFALACAVATERLWLSYPTMDANGEPLLRSHYVDEIERLFAPQALKPRLRLLSEVIPPPAEAVCLRELLEHVSRAGAFELLQQLWPALDERDRDLCDHSRTMAAVESRRYAWGVPFECHDGLLADPAIHARLAAHYHDDHPWSASALGAYGQCPFRFFAERILRLQALQEPEEEVENRDLGDMAHHIIWRFFSERTRDAHESLAEAQIRMAALVAEEFESRQRLGLVTHRKLWQLAADRLREDLCEFVRHELEEMAASGFTHRAAEARYAVQVDIPDGGALRLYGKIDRVDVGPPPPSGEPQQFAVYDYKPGDGVSRNAIESGHDFQMPFYALGAASAVLPGQAPDPQCARWAYYRYRRPVGLKNEVPGKKDPRPPDDYVQEALKHAWSHVQAIRAGRFPVAPAECSSFCDHAAICRHIPWRAQAKTEEASS